MRRAKFKLLGYLMITGCLLIGALATGCSSTSKNGEAADAIDAAHTPEYWPTEAWKTATPESQGMNSEKLVELFDTIQTFNYDIHHVVVIRNGYKVTECNFYPYKRDDIHIINSVTKNVTATLIGKAIDEGLIKSVDEKVLSYFPEQKIENMSPEKAEIKLEQLLTMTSGIKWNENGDYSNPANSSTQMWKSPNQMAYVMNLPIEKSLVGVHNYSTGASHVMSGILSKATGKSTAAYAKEKIWDPLGIKSAYWATDNQGINTGGSRSFYTADDLAKIGFLYLNNGKWDQQQIISENWVKASTEKRIDTPNGPAGFSGYGYQWWMNPYGGYSGRGYNGQYLFVLPEQNIVVVFYSALSGGNFYKPESFVKNYILAAIESPTAVKENKTAYEKLTKAIETLEKGPDASEVPKLPGIVDKINGKTFDVGNGQTVLLAFKEGSTEADLHWFADGIMNDLKVGLDGLYRMSECKNFYLNGTVSKMAVKGSWKDEMNFEAEVRALEADTIYKLSISFNDEKATLTFGPK